MEIFCNFCSNFATNMCHHEFYGFLFSVFIIRIESQALVIGIGIIDNILLPRFYFFVFGFVFIIAFFFVFFFCVFFFVL